MDLTKFIEAVKLAPRYLFALAVASGLLLFGPSQFLSGLGLAGIVESYRPWIGVVFLTSSVLWVSQVGAPTAERWARRAREWWALRKRAEYFNDLTPREKEILRGYIDGDTRTQNFSLMDGSVQGLEALDIVYRATTVGYHDMGFDYNIQPWAWKYLKKNKELLEE